MLFTPLFANEIEDRNADYMIKATEYKSKGNALAIIKIAHQFYQWQELALVEKCIQHARELVLAKRSYALALQIATLYKKLGNEKQSSYWSAVSKNFEQRSKQKWKKN
jgi:hypothetical protein